MLAVDDEMIRTAFDPFAPKPSAGDQPAPLEHGKVYVCGSTEHAAGGHTGPSPTGHGHHHQHRAPLRTPHLLTTLLEAQVMQISCGGRHSALVLSDGELYACGNNEYGKCGFGDTTARTEPTPVPIPLQLGAPPSHVVRVAMVSCGRSHTGFVCTMGELYTYGLGLYGQLGHQSLANQLTPLRVEGVGGAANSVSCGGLHTLVVRADGRALSCGFNDAGCLGRSLDTGKADEGGAVQCSSRLDAVLVSRTASSSDAFAVISAAAGGAHSTLVLADGSVYTCGRGECGQLGHGSNESEAQPRRITALKGIRVRRAACGQAHTLLLTSAGVPYACGGGSFGKLGLGGRASVMVPTPLAHLSAHVIVQISAGDAHSSFVSETGKVFLCGDDGEGQLGLHRGSGGARQARSPLRALSEPSQSPQRAHPRHDLGAAHCHRTSSERLRGEPLPSSSLPHSPRTDRPRAPTSLPA